MLWSAAEAAAIAKGTLTSPQNARIDSGLSRFKGFRTWYFQQHSKLPGQFSSTRSYVFTGLQESSMGLSMGSLTALSCRWVSCNRSASSLRLWHLSQHQFSSG